MAQDKALLEFHIPDRPEAPGAARKALASLNGSLHLVSEARLRDAQLMVSELVANAVRHGGREGEPVTMTVRATRQAMRVEIRDSGPGFERRSAPAPAVDSASGRGLPIVAALAHRWGVDRSASTTVWFEIDLPQHVEPVEIDPTPPELS